MQRFKDNDRGIVGDGIMTISILVATVLTVA